MGAGTTTRQVSSYKSPETRQSKTYRTDRPKEKKGSKALYLYTRMEEENV
jgi:hypothetical protein